MGNQYIGEIRMFAGAFAPQGWAKCNGQLLAISGNEPLFQLIGTTYGGDGTQTFGLPNLQSRVPIHAGLGGGGSYVLGQLSGVENATVTTANLPSHAHNVNANSGGANVSVVTGALPGTATGAGIDYYLNPPTNPVTLASNAIGNSSGTSQPVSVIQPVLAVTFIIALFGIYPTQS
jgi:microcystin-dependent protein